MLVKLPAVLGVDSKSRLGRVREIAAPPTTIDCSVVKYTLGKSVGHVFQSTAGANLLYLFPIRPKSTPLPSDAPVLVAKDVSVDVDELDLTEATWLTHVAKKAKPLPAATVATASRKSWLGAFQFAEEDPRSAVVGLRKPQAGALHAIHAHWSTSGESATVVMPTGTGKTETMLTVLTSACCERVLVVVPTDALRSQIADKFETLGLLKVGERSASGSLAGRRQFRLPVCACPRRQPQHRLGHQGRASRGVLHQQSASGLVRRRIVARRLRVHAAPDD